MQQSHHEWILQSTEGLISLKCDAVSDSHPAVGGANKRLAAPYCASQLTDAKRGPCAGQLGQWANHSNLSLSPAPIQHVPRDPPTLTSTAERTEAQGQLQTPPLAPAPGIGQGEGLGQVSRANSCSVSCVACADLHTLNHLVANKYLNIHGWQLPIDNVQTVLLLLCI